MSDRELTGDAEVDARRRFRTFASAAMGPYATQGDLERRLDARVIGALRQEGYLGGPLARDHGGGGMDMVTYGLLTAEIGRACSSARTLLTVHNLVGLTLQRWGNAWIKAAVLPEIATGTRLAAIALSEPAAGSDIQSIQTKLCKSGDSYRLNGRKAWVSFGALADWLLVFAQTPDGPVAMAVAADTPGLSRIPVPAMSGTRAAMMADIVFEDCAVRPEQLVGKPGFGLSHVAALALDHGRYSVAWGAVGVAEAALAAAVDHLENRRQFGGRMIELPLAQSALSRVFARNRAARQLCLHAGRLRAARKPSALLETMVAKYFAAQCAVEAANEAVRLCGARGMCEAHPAERLLRDAKILEIIEGGEEIHEVLIAAQLNESTMNG